MDPIAIIQKYYDKESKLYKILLKHSKQVRDKALKVVEKHPNLGADAQFIEEAAMLHDIGIYLTNAPDIECFGTRRYVEHGYLGSAILALEGYPQHGLVCERHTGLGISLKAIMKRELPIPHRDMLPMSIEEKIICYADKFYSKSKLNKELKVEKIVSKLGKYDKTQPKQFMEWHKLFG